MNDEPLKVGDFVRIRFGLRWITAKVIEDRGGLCVDGGQLVRVRVGGQEWELPAKHCRRPKR